MPDKLDALLERLIVHQSMLILEVTMAVGWRRAPPVARCSTIRLCQQIRRQVSLRSAHA